MISNRCARKSLVTNCNSIISKNYLRLLVDSNELKYIISWLFYQYKNNTIKSFRLFDTDKTALFLFSLITFSNITFKKAFLILYNQEKIVNFETNKTKTNRYEYTCRI